MPTADEQAILGTRTGYVNFVHGQDFVTLDGAYSVEELKKIVAYMEAHK